LSATAACQPTQTLYPVTQYWAPQDYWKPGSYAGQSDMAIIIPLPEWPGSRSFSIQTTNFPVNLLNETVQPIVGGWWNCNAMAWPTGNVYFEIHGIDSNDNDELIDAIPIGRLSASPSCLQEYNVSNYKSFYFKINVENVYTRAPYPNAYCAAIIVPVGFIARGTLPPPSQTANIQVYVYDSSSMAPIPNATVTITDPYGYVNAQKITGSNGVAYFNVPFSTADTYYFSVTASHYKSGGATYTGQEIENNNYYIRIGLTPEKPTVLSSIESFAKDVGIALIVVGVAAAGFAVYKVLSKSGFTFRKLSKKSEEKEHRE